MNNDDVTLMAERIGALQEENKTLRKRLERKKREQQKLSCRAIWDHWWTGLTIFLLSCFLLSLIGYPLYKWATVPDVPSHCAIEVSPTITGSVYLLYGVTAWHIDGKYGRYNDLESAQSAAKALNCDIPAVRGEGDSHER